MKRFIRLYAAIIIGILLGVAVMYGQIRSEMGAPATSGVAGTVLGGSFAGLTDQNGVVVDDARFAGKAQLVFFGFTHCPSICPTELQKMTVMLKDLSPEQQARIAPIFVSVDPERDTTDVLKNYLAMFNSTITGLTGTPEQIESVKKDWKVYSAKVKTEEMTEYTVDHSAYSYFRGPDGRLIALFSGHDGADVMTRAVKDYLD